MFEKEREAMVSVQLTKRGIANKYVIDVMTRIERHRFIPKSHEGLSYGDFAVPIGHGQTISQPFVVAKMLELLDPQVTDKVLEIGSGCGYVSALLSNLCSKVLAIERIPELAQESKRMFKSMHIKNIGVIVGDGSLGAIHYYPFDKIIVSAAIPDVPQELIDQLRLGGILVAPVGSRMSQKIVKIVKHRDKVDISEHDAVAFLPMKGKRGFEF